MPKKNHRINRRQKYTINALLVASVLLIGITADIMQTFGGTAYYLAFHQPFHLTLFKHKPKYAPPALPQFSVQAKISNGGSLQPGDTETISLALTANMDVKGYAEVWITSPANNQVFRSDTDDVPPLSFTKGRTQNLQYNYQLTNKLPAGTYTVSVIITSSDTFTDYYVNYNFASFHLL